MSNAIVVENQQRTTVEAWQALGMSAGEDPRDVWDAAASNQIEGFTADISYDIGQDVQFKINVNAQAADTTPYRIEIYRLGYYGGDGARLVDVIYNTDGTVQPDPVTDARGLVDAGNWSVSDSWHIPDAACSGVYLAKLVRLDANGDPIPGATNQIPFVVRDDTPADGTKSDIIFQTSDTTWQAYNAWSGNNGQVDESFYSEPQAHAVSYNRPIVTRDGGGVSAGAQDYLFGADYAAIYWLEQNGYDVSYMAGVDTDRLGASNLVGHKAFISVGHDEYWSGGQRANVEAARDAGVNLLFWSGNEVYWRTRYEPSIAGTATDYRTLVCYKETYTNHDPDAPATAYTNLDPSNEWTGTWRDVRFADAVDANGVHIAVGAQAENSLTGQYTVATGSNDTGGALDIPEDYTGLRYWRGTAVAGGSGTLDLSQGIIGFEWDTAPNDANRPAGLIRLSETVLPWSALITDQGNTTSPGTATHSLTLYRAASGALVFGAGTVFWSWGLSNQHDPIYNVNAESAIIQQFTVNMFADMGIQPETLQAGLHLATASTDHTPATVAMNDLPALATAGQTFYISGTAVDPDDGNPATEDGVVAVVEISFDGGQTWRAAAGTGTWTYAWTPTAAGTYQVLSRAWDDSLNTPVAVASATVQVAPGTLPAAINLFAPDAQPEGYILDAWDPTDYELGMQFTVSEAGSITELRYLRGAVDADDVDVRTLHLWDTADPSAPIATVTVTSGVGATGWQVAQLSTAVHIEAGHTYVVSYGTTENYAVTRNYFSQSHSDSSGILTGLASGVSGGNGVFIASPGSFPVYSYGDTNYWVDVTFAADGAVTNQAPVIFSGGGGASAAVTVAENRTAATVVGATDANTGDVVTYSISGTDAARFVIDPVTGVLRFLSAPDFEAPADVGADNVYDIVVTARDQRGGVDTQALAVTVSNANDTGTSGSLSITGYAPPEDADATVVLTATNTLVLDPVGVIAGSAQLQWQRLVGTTWSNVGVVGSTELSVTDGTGLYRIVYTYADASGIHTFVSSNTVSVGAAGVQTFSGTSGADIILALGGADTINWSPGADIVDGGRGIDTMSYAGTTAGVTIDMRATATVPGLDITVSARTATGADLGGTQYLLGVESFIGGSGDDTLIGFGAGFDGGAGIDTILLNSTSANLNGASDAAITNVEIVSAVGALVALNIDLSNQTEGFNIRCSDRGDVIQGGRGNDTLDGGTGRDTMSYAAALSAVSVSLGLTSAQDTGGAGIDTLARFENLTGSSFDDTLTGSGGANVVDGGAGNDRLDGAAGADTLIGGDGDDTYVVDNAGDVVTEAAGQGIDLVLASLTTTLAANVERLTLTGTGSIGGTGNGLDNLLTGNSGRNALSGGDGNDTLDGGAGSDTMTGGNGNDTFVVERSSDVVSEAAGGGTDTVQSSISYTLGANLENLTLMGTASISATGNTLANMLVGNSGSNTISGGSGNDTLTGGLGNDNFVFNSALGTANIDTITDFSSSASGNNDVIRLDDAIFTALGTGATHTISSSQFVANAGGIATSSSRIIYDTNTGALYYDRDGSGSLYAKVQFATLSGHPTIAYNDFVVF